MALAMCRDLNGQPAGPAAAATAGGVLTGEIILFEDNNFHGNSISSGRPVSNAYPHAGPPQWDKR